MSSEPGSRMSRSATTAAGVRHNRPMDPKDDPLSRDMRVERLRREDGRALLLYTWPERTEETVPPPVADTPPPDAWSPDSGPADV